MESPFLMMDSAASDWHEATAEYEAVQPALPITLPSGVADNRSAASAPAGNPTTPERSLMASANAAALPRAGATPSPPSAASSIMMPLSAGRGGFVGTAEVVATSLVASPTPRQREHTPVRQAVDGTPLRSLAHEWPEPDGDNAHNPATVLDFAGAASSVEAAAPAQLLLRPPNASGQSPLGAGDAIRLTPNDQGSVADSWAIMEQSREDQYEESSGAHEHQPRHLAKVGPAPGAVADIDVSAAAAPATARGALVTPQNDAPLTAGRGQGELTPLGDEWRQAYDNGSGRKYYYNRRTRETSWRMPSGAIRVKKSPADAHYRIFTPTPAKERLERADEEGDGGRPTGKRLFSQATPVGAKDHRAAAAPSSAQRRAGALRRSASGSPVRRSERSPARLGAGVADGGSRSPTRIPRAQTTPSRERRYAADERSPTRLAGAAAPASPAPSRIPTGSSARRARTADSRSPARLGGDCSASPTRIPRGRRASSPLAAVARPQTTPARAGRSRSASGSPVAAGRPRSSPGATRAALALEAARALTGTPTPADAAPSVTPSTAPTTARGRVAGSGTNGARSLTGLKRLKNSRRKQQDAAAAAAAVASSTTPAATTGAASRRTPETVAEVGPAAVAAPSAEQQQRATTAPASSEASHHKPRLVAAHTPSSKAVEHEPRRKLFAEHAVAGPGMHCPWCGDRQPIADLGDHFDACAVLERCRGGPAEAALAKALQRTWALAPRGERPDELPALAAEQQPGAFDAAGDECEGCPSCGRTFAKGRLEVHAKVCKQVFVERRMEYSAKARRQRDKPWWVKDEEEREATERASRGSNMGRSSTMGESFASSFGTRESAAARRSDAGHHASAPALLSQAEAEAEADENDDYNGGTVQTPPAARGRARTPAGSGACSACPWCTRQVPKSGLSSHLLSCKRLKSVRAERAQSPARPTLGSSSVGRAPLSLRG